ncbi:hypothetical protein E4U58_003473 [Claviceps cyperi]|nr:hypothetical protein E4U58_003473 [Claviceps cyperi]
MAAAGIAGSGGIKNGRYIRHKDTRGIRDIPEGKNDDQVSVDPRAKIGHHDLVKSRPGSRGRGVGCNVVATRAIGATTTETDTQSETATVTASATTVSPVTDFSGQEFADGKIALRNAPRHPPSTPLNRQQLLRRQRQPLLQPAGIGSRRPSRLPLGLQLPQVSHSYSRFFSSVRSIAGDIDLAA